MACVLISHVVPGAVVCVAGGDYAVVCDCWGLWWRLCCCAVFFFQLCCVRLVGIMLLVYVKERLQRHVSDVEVDQVPTGMHGIMVRRVWSAGWVWHQRVWGVLRTEC